MIAKRAVKVGVVSALVLAAGMVTAQSTMRPEDMVKIRKVSKLNRMEVETPEYSATGSGSSRKQKDWQRILVQYDTAPAWIDDLSITYTLLCEGVDADGQKAFSLYRLTVRHTDVEQGRDHLAAAYLRPPATKRYGKPVAVAVEVKVNGQPAGVESDAPGNFGDEWWKNPRIVDNDAVTVREGYLMNRKDTPFYLINYDDYEVIK